MKNDLKRLSLKTQLSAVVLLLLIGSYWLLTFAIERRLEADMIGILEAQQYSAVSYIAADIDGKIQQRIDLLNQAAHQVADHMASPDHVRNFLKSRIDLQSLFQAGLIVIDRNGRGIADYPVVTNRENGSFGEMEYFREVLATGRASIGKPRIGRFTRKPGIAIATPVRDGSGSVIAVLTGFATLADKSLFGQVERGITDKSGWILVSSPRDRLIVSSNISERILQPLPASGSNQMLDRFLAGYEGSGLTASYGDVQSLVSAKKIPSTGWIVHATLPTQEAFAPLRTMRKNAYGLAAGLTVLMALAVWVLIRRTLTPLARATATIRAMVAGEERMHPLTPAGDSEIHDLLTSFNSLVEQRKAKESELRASRQFMRTTLDGLTAHICALDEHGTILAVNRAWKDFSEANQDAPLRGEEGTDYLATCEDFSVGDGSSATQLAAGLREVLAGRAEFFDIEYQCALQTGSRWFLARVSRLGGTGPGRVVVAHEDITERKHAEEAVREARDYAENLIHTANVLVVELDLTGKVKLLNPAAETITGYRKEELMGRNWFDTIVPRERYPTVWERFEKIATEGVAKQFENPILTKAGEERFIVWQNSTVIQGGEISGFVSFGIDMTEQRRMSQRLSESEERFRTIAHYTYDWEYWQGTNGEIIYINPACQRISGYAPEEFIANPALLNEIVHPDDREKVANHHLEVQHQEVARLDFRIITKTGEVRWIGHGCRAVSGTDGRPMGRRASNRDITNRKNAEERAHRLAFFDSLTNLPNRRMLLDRLHQGLAQAKRFHRALAIMFLDLDHFKQINDTLGHDVGDELLKEVAQRLTTSVRVGDTVARTGGDEFVIVLPEIAQPTDAAVVAEKIIRALVTPIVIHGTDIQTSTSIGISIYPVDGIDDARALMKKADMAMYAAKASGRNGYQLYDELPKTPMS